MPRAVHKQRAEIGWRSELQSILHKHNRDHLRKAKVVSHETVEDRAYIMHLSFEQLWTRHKMKVRPRNLGLRHVKTLLNAWASDGLSASTLQKRLSCLRGFANWICKPGMIPKTAELLPDHLACRTYVAQYDHSWSAHGVDAGEVIVRVQAWDPYVARQLLAILAFGLRKKEALCLRPRLADQGAFLSVSVGTKGGRDRSIPINQPVQREILDMLKASVGSLDAHLGRPGQTLKQSTNRFEYAMKRFGITKKTTGVTAHGLRHQVLLDVYERITGHKARVRGGQAPAGLDQLGRHIVAMWAGHERPPISGAYLGGRIDDRPRKNVSLKCRVCEANDWSGGAGG